MRTYEVTLWGTKNLPHAPNQPWMQTHNLITEYQVTDSVLVLRTKMEGVPYFEKGYTIHAIEGWEAKEEVKHS